jgi:UDP-N-acetylglucosamine 2-epimerase (non-hydrolysing)
MKAAPLLKAASTQTDWQCFLVHTGQHYAAELSDLFFQQLKLPSPHINLGAGSGTPAVQMAEIMVRFEKVMQDIYPDLVVVVGDVTSTLACALVAAKLCVPVAHIEAGLRSFDRTMPEEINRVLTDAVADYLFATEAAAVENLSREGRPRERIYLVGNVMIDSLRQCLALSQTSEIGRELGLLKDTEYRPFALLTLHRPSNVDSSGPLKALLQAIERVADQVPVFFPVHPRTEKELKKLAYRSHPQLHLIRPLGYLEFICLLSHSRLVLTDSGGIQEETTALGVPCLTLRENTERPVTVTEGTNQLVGRDPDRIVAAALQILGGNRKVSRIPALWDGRAAERIVEILVRETSVRQRGQDDEAPQARAIGR